MMAIGLGGGVFTDNQWHRDVAVFLIEKGADVNAKDKKGRTPLMYACGAAHLYYEHDFSPQLINALLEFGADKEVKSDETLNAYDYLVNLYEGAKEYHPEEKYELALEALRQ